MDTREVRSARGHLIHVITKSVERGGQDELMETASRSGIGYLFVSHTATMSSMLKNASKRADAAIANGKNKGKGKGLPVTDIVSAEQDMAMELDVDEESEEDIAEEEVADVKQKSGKGKQVVKTTTGAVGEKGKPRKDKVLLLSSRNTTGRMRHFMLDLQALLPHTKKGESPSGFSQAKSSHFGSLCRRQTR
jgi:hypothetical protein